MFSFLFLPCGVKRETHSSGRNRKLSKAMESIDHKIEIISTAVGRRLEFVHPLSDQRCIYRVPKRLHQLNEKAYTPQLVSIGPLHHGKQELQAMEDYKSRYLQQFLQLVNLSVGTCIKLIMESEVKLRNYYAETILLSSEDFVNMILLDASFLIMLVLKHYLVDLRGSDDAIFNRPWMVTEINYDLLLLENQLPFFILEDLLKLTDYLARHEGLSMIKLLHEYSKQWWPLWVKEDALGKKDFSDVKHIVDFLSIYHRPSQLPSPKNCKQISLPSVTELHQTGVKFKLSSSKNFFDINFRNGILEIPLLIIDDRTEIFLRNLHAFEQCHCSPCDRYLSQCTILMAKLFNAAKDVELLARTGIINNCLVDNEALSTLFRDLVRGLCVGKIYFSDLEEELNKYYRSPWHRRKANLKQNYFNSPWAGISVFAATILLTFSIIQAVCSILQVKQGESICCWA
ncbi:putative UPF0481 protein At3g02645 isoform X2 [Hevea brasiliensis]|uniref:putative UPF0481 protein At3g02645 isoform X2 n=1 Tax=Hevea brasiliensis TaxID=3981 RepID=UPI0025F1BDB5|nr:putative UPF0481 protein At3g02645 isoform X2 [Hevea brasiliensis]